MASKRVHADVEGTRFGRDWHRRRGEQPCDSCRLAWNEATRLRIKAARQRGWIRPDREAPKRSYHPGSCSKCRRELARTAADEPMCATCRGNKPGYNTKISRAERLAIYERDEWRCQVCLEDVDGELPATDAWSATLDHIQPCSLGGSDDPENLRLAHRWCNSVRGNLRFYSDDDFRIA